jgi:hypothetical protein
MPSYALLGRAYPIVRLSLGVNLFGSQKISLRMLVYYQYNILINKLQKNVVWIIN